MCLSGISFGRYCRKVLPKAVGLQKRQKGVAGHIEGLAIEETQTFCALCLKIIQDFDQTSAVFGNFIKSVRADRKLC